MDGRFGRLAVTGALALLLTVSVAASGAPADAPMPITFRLDTNFLPKHGIFFAAQGLGFYEQEGLDVSFQPSTGSADTSATVGQGKADFGFADFDTMAKAAVNGAPVEQLAVIHAVNPSAVITLPETNIHSFQDLKGKKIAGEPNGATTIFFPLALQLCHMSMKDVDFLTVDARAKLPGLQAGRWQAFVALAVSDPATMIGEGLNPVVIPYRSCKGFSGYSNGLIANTKMIQEHPEVVQKFVTATLRGVQWACNNQAAAAQNTLKYVPPMNLRAAEAGIRLACGVAWTPGAERHGLGYMDPKEVAHTVGLAKQFLGLTRDVDLGKLYTNQFNERAHVLKSTVVEAPQKK